MIAYFAATAKYNLVCKEFKPAKQVATLYVIPDYVTSAANFDLFNHYIINLYYH